MKLGTKLSRLKLLPKRKSINQKVGLVGVGKTKSRLKKMQKEDKKNFPGIKKVK